METSAAGCKVPTRTSSSSQKKKVYYILRRSPKHLEPRVPSAFCFLSAYKFSNKLFQYDVSTCPPRHTTRHKKYRIWGTSEAQRGLCIALKRRRHNCFTLMATSERQRRWLSPREDVKQKILCVAVPNINIALLPDKPCGAEFAVRWRDGRQYPQKDSTTARNQSEYFLSSFYPTVSCILKGVLWCYIVSVPPPRKISWQTKTTV